MVAQTREDTDLAGNGASRVYWLGSAEGVPIFPGIRIALQVRRQGDDNGERRADCSEFRRFTVG